MHEFGSLYYTDCRAGEGLLGGAGFQFQAISPGVDPRDMDLVQRNCLYEPPARWMREQRPEAAYPRSLAHIFDGQFATASGCYLGTEAKGAREGNHFTHALVGSDIELFGQVRPAQLWRAPFWVDRPSPSTVCDPIPDEPDPGPLHGEWLQHWVGEQPDGEAMLTAVVSALEGIRRGGTRIVFVAEEPDPVLAWLAAATILMPRIEALRIGFKVFAVNVQYSAHDVVALHPDWAGVFNGAPAGTGFVVFDLVSESRSEVVPTTSARYWVPRFLQRDCFDVMDAVEFSGALRGSSSPGVPADEERDERIVAAALTLTDRPLEPTELDPVISWLGRPSAILTEQRREQLFERVLASTPDIEQLRRLAEIADRLRATRFAEHIRWRLFAREMGAAVNGAEDVSPEPEFLDKHDVTRWVEAVLARSEPASLARVLTIAGRYQLAPEPATFRRALDAFVRWWADSADTLPEVDSWPCRDQVVDLLRDELAGRIVGQPSSFGRRVGELWWSRLWMTIQDPRSPLDMAIVTAAMSTGGDEVRESLIRTVLSRLRDGGGADGVDVAWRLLFADGNAGIEGVLAALRLAANHRLLSAGTAHEMARVMERQEHPTAPVLDALVLLGELGHLLSSSSMATLQHDSMKVRSVTAYLQVQRLDDAEFPPGTVTDIADQLETVARPVWAVYASELVRVLLPLHPEMSSALIMAIDKEHRRILVAQLGKRLEGGANDRTLALCVRLITDLTERDRLLSRRLRRSLIVHRKRTAEVPPHKVMKLLSGPAQAALWSDITRTRSSGLWMRRRIRSR